MTEASILHRRRGNRVLRKESIVWCVRDLPIERVTVMMLRDIVESVILLKELA